MKSFFLFLLLLVVGLGPTRAQELTLVQRSLVQQARHQNDLTRNELTHANSALADWQATSDFYEKSVADYAAKADAVAGERDRAYNEVTTLRAANDAAEAKIKLKDRRIHRDDAVLGAALCLLYFFVVRPWHPFWFTIPYVGAALWAFGISLALAVGCCGSCDLLRFLMQATRSFLASVWTHLSFFRSVYIYVPLSIVLTLAAMYGVPLLTGRAVVDDPGVLSHWLPDDQDRRAHHAGRPRPDDGVWLPQQQGGLQRVRRRVRRVQFRLPVRVVRLLDLALREKAMRTIFLPLVWPGRVGTGSVFASGGVRRAGESAAVDGHGGSAGAVAGAEGLPPVIETSFWTRRRGGAAVQSQPTSGVAGSGQCCNDRDRLRPGCSVRNFDPFGLVDAWSDDGQSFGRRPSVPRDCRS